MNNNDRGRGHEKKAREDPMDQSNYKEALERLRQDGFTASEIKLLCQLRREYSKQGLDHVSIDLHRLEFARWLVATGKLTDQLDAPQLPWTSRWHHV